METRTRTVVKAIGWQLLGLFTMSALGWIFTGSLLEGGAIALSGMAVGFVTYILYERAWAGIRWGRHQHAPQDR
ncbi:MAG: DUF2061 domain-containing protein [Rubricella sp.]